MDLFTIGYAKKSAEKFFNIISNNDIEIVADVRLYNSTQSAGFCKSVDLQYFLRKICGCNYIELKNLAPNPALFENYKNGSTGWNEYERIYNRFLDREANLGFFYAFKNKSLFEFIIIKLDILILFLLLLLLFFPFFEMFIKSVSYFSVFSMNYLVVFI